MAVAACFLTTIGLAACESQRPLYLVKDRAEYYGSIGKYDEAAQNWEEYVERRPNDPAAHYKLGEAYIALNQPKKAREHMSLAVDVDPNNEQYLDGLADAYFRAGEYQQLSAYLNRLTIERGTLRDYLRLGIYSTKIGNADEALTALRTAARLDRGINLAPQMALANFYATVGDRKNLVSRLAMCYYLAPQNDEVLRMIREAGEIPGPTFGVRPEEADLPAGQ